MKKIFKTFSILIFSLSLLLNPYIFNQNNIYAEIDSTNFIEKAYLFGDYPLGSNSYYGTLLRKGDMNDDGYEDLITSNQNDATLGNRTGKIYIYFGGPDADYTADITITGEAAANAVGSYYGVSVGDLNNDNINDLIFNAWGNSEGGASAGKLYIFWGPLEVGNYSASSANVTHIGNTTTEKMYGYINKTNDLNNDGIDDLVLWIPTSVFTSTKIYIYYGKNDFNLDNPDIIINAPDATNLFGYAIYSEGDFDGDNYNDFIIYDNNSKKMFLYWGGDPLDITYDATFSPEDLNGSFGGVQSNQSAIFDLNQDGRDDFCTSAYTSDIPVTNAGTVYCWYGPENRSSWSGDLPAGDADIIVRSDEVNNSFGRYISFNDLNNDGNSEMLVGAYQSGKAAGQGHGKIYVYNNNAGILEIATPAFTLGYNSYDKEFGNIFIVFDFNYNGYLDLFVLEGPNRRESSLRVYELASGNSTITPNTFTYTNDTTPTLTGTVTNTSKTVSYEKVETLLGTGTGSQWDTVHSGYSPSIIKDGETYKMWYASQADKYRIGYATSPDGITWTKYNGNNCSGTTGDGCIFDVGIANSFDDAHIYGVSVVKDPDAGIYKMWYTGHDGSYLRIGYATSPDGITWTKYDDPGVAACGFTEAYDNGCVFNRAAANTWDDYHVGYPQVIRESATSYKMYYTGHDQTNWRAGYATSTDGITWTRAVGINYCSGTTGDGCIINMGASGESDDNGILSGPIINDNGVYKMWYSGHDGDKWQTFYATSNNGISFTKYSQNPVLAISTDNISPDQRHVYLPQVMKEGSTYRMWYGAQNGNYTVSYATSTNGTTWSKRMTTYSNTYSKNIKGVQWSFSNTLPGTWNDCDAADGNFNSNSENFNCTISTLNDGAHTVYLRYYDEDELYLPVLAYSSSNFTIDTVVPDTGSITINSGDAITNSLEAALTLSASDALSGVTSMMISESSFFTGASWESYSTTKAYTLTSSDGTKTVYVKFKDAAGNESSVYSDTIILDTTDPEGPVVIESPTSNEYTNSQTITLELSGTDELTEVVLMMICENESFEGCSWETYSTTKEFILSSGDGVKTLYVKYQDGAGNESATQTVTIILDTTTTINLTKINDTDFNADLTDWEVNTKRPTFMGTGEPGSTITIYSDEVIIGTTTVDAEGNWSFTPETDLTEGDHTITFTSTDLASNTDTLTFNLNVLGTSNVQELPDTGVSIIVILFLTLITFWLAVNFRVIERLQKYLRR